MNCIVFYAPGMLLRTRHTCFLLATSVSGFGTIYRLNGRRIIPLRVFFIEPGEGLISHSSLKLLCWPLSTFGSKEMRLSFRG